MNDDRIFHIILMVGFVLVMPIGIYHRFKSSTGEKLDRRQEGLFILITLRLVGLAGAVGLVAYMVDPSSMAWSSLSLSSWWRWFGVVLGVAAGSLLAWTLHTLGKNLTDTVVTRENHSLITNGPYRWVRHPFYDSAFLAITANGLVAANWFFLAAGGVFFALVAIRTCKEEELLIARFGNAYRSYIGRTGRFIPILKSPPAPRDGSGG